MEEELKQGFVAQASSLRMPQFRGLKKECEFPCVSGRLARINNFVPTFLSETPRPRRGSNRYHESHETRRLEACATVQVARLLLESLGQARAVAVRKLRDAAKARLCFFHVVRDAAEGDARKIQ